MVVIASQSPKKRAQSKVMARRAWKYHGSMSQSPKKRAQSKERYTLTIEEDDGVSQSPKKRAQSKANTMTAMETMELEVSIP